MTARFLLASHGSVGGAAAEQAAIAACVPGDELDHLYVVPSWWSGMTGDDWLNNGISRNRFRDYIEQQLWEESQQVCARIKHQCMGNKIKYNFLLRVGCSDEVLNEVAKQHQYQTIFIGERRPKHCAGLRDTMLTPRLKKHLNSNLRIVSHPDEQSST